MRTEGQEQGWPIGREEEQVPEKVGPRRWVLSGTAHASVAPPDTTQTIPEDRDSDLDLIPPLELCIRTK